MIEQIRKTLFDWWRRLTNPVGRFLVSRLNSVSDFDEDDTMDDVQEEARKEFLEIFAKRSWRYTVFWAGFVLFGVTIADIVACGTLQNQTYGLALDLTGAVILGRGLVKGPIPIAKEASTGWGYTPAVVTSLSKDAVDGIFGITFLIVGILFQFIAIAHLFPGILPDAQSLCSVIQ